MIIYILKRIGLAFLTFLVTMFIIYLLQSIFGNNPLTSPSEADSGLRTGVVDNTELIKKYWVDRNPILRFLKWFGELFTGYLGPVYSASSGVKLPSTFFQSFRWTIIITIPSFFLSAIFGVALGTIAAYKRAKVLDTSIIISTSIIAAIPTFILAPIVIIFTYKYLGLPLEFQVPQPQRGIGWSATIASIVAPVFVLTITGMSGYAVYTRNQMINVLTSNHVLIAKAKGLSGTKIFFKHVLRNASIPIMALIIPGYIVFLSGSIVLERFFGVPGSAQVLFNAQKIGELNVIMFGAMFYGTLILTTSIIVDVMYTILDPQIKFANNNSNKSFLKRYLSFLARKKIVGRSNNA